MCLVFTFFGQMENISVEWHGWVDDDSGILTYTLAVFSMTKNNNSELEVNVDALSDPVFGPIEVMMSVTGRSATIYVLS